MDDRPIEHIMLTTVDGALQVNMIDDWAAMPRVSR